MFVPRSSSALLALEGGTSRHDGVLTIATTNDLDAIDEAARRSGRFDTVGAHRTARRSRTRTHASPIHPRAQAHIDVVASPR